MKTIKNFLTLAASIMTVTGLAAYLITGMWHLLFIAIAACVIGLTLKDDLNDEKA